MQIDGKLIILILVLIGVLFLLHWFRKRFKTLSLPCVFFISGAVKSGKTGLGVSLVRSNYRKALTRYYVRKVLTFIILPKRYKYTYRMVDKILKDNNNGFYDVEDGLKDYFPPMVYSNIPLANIRFNRLTIDIINNEVRIPNQSIVFIDEISLFADSQLFKDKDLNNKLMRFFKLYGHYSHGGKLIIDSQSIADNHFSLRRCMSSYVYIQESRRLPFITLMKVREMVYSEDKSAVNVVDKDLELDLRTIIIFNGVFKLYDRYAYSVFSDYLPVNVMYSVDKLNPKDSLKCDYIVTLNEFVKDMNNNLYDHKVDVGLISIDDDGVVERKEVDDNEKEN